MKLTQRHVDVINQMYERNKPLAQGNDDQRRQLTRMIAEQLCFEGGPTWGTKSQSPSHPQSKDAISFMNSSSHRNFEIWDWQNGTTRAPQVQVGQAGVQLTNQWFIDVSPVNHLGSSPTPDPDPTPDPGGEEIMEKLDEIEAKLDGLHTEHGTIIGKLQAVEASLGDLHNKMSDVQLTVNKIYAAVAVFPPYSGRVSLTGTTTLNPVYPPKKDG